MRSPLRLGRRSFLELLTLAFVPTGAATATGCAVPEPAGKSTNAISPTEPSSGEDAGAPGSIVAAIFGLGVASGDPMHDRVLLWTRLVDDPKKKAAKLPAVPIVVEWIIARDEALTDIVKTGVTVAKPEHGHAVRADVDGLEPATTYFYAFRLGPTMQSPVGRTKTLPAPDAHVEKIRFAVASCQNWQDGHYTAHAHLAEEDIDFVLFLGDYIYDEGVRSNTIRQHDGVSPRTLDEYRQRHALYKSDVNLQAAHAKHPWITIWDDHEVAQNYGGDFSGGEDPSPNAFDARRAAAYKAYWEHLPVRCDAPTGTSMQLYRNLVIGDLAHLHMLDGRQYRSKPLCDGKIRPGACGERDAAPEMSMLGHEQEEWLKTSLFASTQKWKLIGNNVMMSPFEIGALINHDQWDGYTSERERLFDVFEKVGDVVVFTGDIHTALMSEIPNNSKLPGKPNVGVEIVTTSVSSGGLQGILDLVSQVAKRLPYVKYINPKDRGYMICELTQDKLTVSLRAVNDVMNAKADIKTVATWSVDKGVSKVKREA